jgi:hypothetical protein
LFKFHWPLITVEFSTTPSFIATFVKWMCLYLEFSVVGI